MALKQMVLLKYDGGERTTFFVIDHGARYDPDGVREPDEINAEHVRYVYEEHSCPTNWLDKCVAVIEDGDSDPHGFLDFVRVVDVPEDFDGDEGGEEAAGWRRIFPEAFAKNSK